MTEHAAQRRQRSAPKRTEPDRPAAATGEFIRSFQLSSLGEMQQFAPQPSPERIIEKSSHAVPVIMYGGGDQRDVAGLERASPGQAAEPRTEGLMQQRGDRNSVIFAGCVKDLSIRQVPRATPL